mgnify:CR=1 FL=1
MALSRAVLRVAEQHVVRSRSTCLLFGTGAGRNLELSIDPGMVGQAALRSFILSVLVLGSPISLGFDEFDRTLRAVQDMVD